MTDTVACPLCGTGQIKKSDKDIRAEYIKNMSDAGLPYQRIADVLGIKSINTIHYYLKRRPRKLTTEEAKRE